MFLFISASLSCFGQKDAKARNILDKTVSSISNSGGIKINFKGTNNGTLLIKGDKFYLNSGEIQTWFDGKTQWSYVKNANEVNITNPTLEDLQAVNPYYLLSSYRKGYNYKYIGEKSIGGKAAYEILLTPEKKDQIENITIFITKNYQPISINIKVKNQGTNDFQITNYNTKQNFGDIVFRFEKKKFPDVEVIDLR